MLDDNNHVKVLFRYHSDILDELTVETMWAEKVNERIGLYKLDSIPFYGAPIATDDEFLAEFDESEQMLTFKGVTKFSENSIVTVSIIKDGVDKEPIRELFKSMNCISEGLNDSYFAMEIPYSVNYPSIKSKLDEFETNEILAYAEPCLSDKHRHEIEN
jgi:hypothetical protein